MNTLARIASTFLALSIPLVSMTAMASPTSGDAATAEARGAPHRHAQPAYPMKADPFRKMIEKKIEHVKTRIDKAMDRHHLPAPARAEVNKAVDSAVKQVHTAVDKVTADGVVTKEEAQEVKELAEQLRAQLKEQMKEKSSKGKTPAQAK